MHCLSRFNYLTQIKNCLLKMFLKKYVNMYFTFQIFTYIYVNDDLLNIFREVFCNNRRLFVYYCIVDASSYCIVHL